MSTVEIPSDLLGQSSLYNSPDPLLRRLRLEDSNGQSVSDVDRYFRDKEVVVLYAGSEQGANNIKEFHRNLSRLGLREHKTCSIIYVSTDTQPEEAKRVLATQPWLRMTFCDNSDFAPLVPLRDGNKVTEMEEVARGEDFVQAGEMEMGAEKVQFEEEEYQHDYVRPLSRAAVTVIMNAFSTPSVAVYHIPSHKFVSKNVRMTAFTPDKIDKNYSTWKNGGTPTLRIFDILHTLRYQLFALLVALAYHLLVYFGGQQYNFIPTLMDKLNGRLLS